MVTALSVVPLRDLARGSSLTNATRNLVQAIGVAVLATILASTLSPATQALQNQAAQASVRRPGRARRSLPTGVPGLHRRSADQPTGNDAAAAAGRAVEAGLL